MNNFALDQRLKADTYPLLDDENMCYLLHRNAEVVWFILVPKCDHTELYQLEGPLQKALYAQVNRLSAYLHQKQKVDKINIASIGNVVAQLHVHVIGRRTDDAYWPDVIWGKPFNKTYDTLRVESIRSELVRCIQHQ